MGKTKKRKERPASSSGEDSFVESRQPKRMNEDQTSIDMAERGETALGDINERDSEAENLSDGAVKKLLQAIANAKTETVCELSKGMEAIKTELESIRGTIHEVKVENERLQTAVTSLERARKEDGEKLRELDVLVKKQAKALGDLEQYGRKANVKIYGLKDEGEGETHVETERGVEKLCRDKLGVVLDKGDISIAHRIGRSAEGTNRSIIVKFTRRVTKEKIMKQRYT